MARLDWTTFLATHPQAHLLAGHVPEPNAAVLKRLRRLMQALIAGATSPRSSAASPIAPTPNASGPGCGRSRCRPAASG